MEEKHSLEQKKLDVEAIQAGRCPECQADLSNMSAAAHAEEHWQQANENVVLGADAARRKKLVLNYHKAQTANAEAAAALKG